MLHQGARNGPSKMPDSSPEHTAMNQEVNTILQNLNWQSLETRRLAARLVLFYKTIHGKAEVDIPTYVQKTSVTGTDKTTPLQ